MTKQAAEMPTQLPLNKRYKAMFRGVTLEDKEAFKASKVIVPISVGQKYHEEGEFEATIKLINKSFGSCVILVADTLKRHSLTFDEKKKSEEELILLSTQAGDRWLERNTKYINMLSIPYAISRWDEWRNNADYSHYDSLVHQLYKEDEKYKNIVHEIIQSFLSRSGRNGDQGDKFERCLNYVLEESAVTCLWVKAGFKFDVYPTGDNKAMIYAYEKFIKTPATPYRSLSLNIKKISTTHSDVFMHQEKALYQIIATDNLLTHIPGHIYWKNKDGIFLGCNDEQARYLNLKDPNEIVGKTNFDLVDYETAIKITEADNSVIETGEAQIVEEVLYGSQYFLSKKMPLRDFKGKIVGIFGTSIEITKQKNLEQSLKQRTQDLALALELKQRFIRNINHEIRTPMQSILNGPQALKDNFYTTTDEEKLIFIQGMLDASIRLNSLVTNILDISKFQEGKFVLEFKDENIRNLLQEIVQEFQMSHGDIRIVIDKDVQENLLCDKLRLHQVFRNLIVNSIRYGGKTSTITISVSHYEEASTNHLKFSVKDEGIGIPKSEKYSVFEPFVEGEMTRTNAGGTGLGLTISREIIE